MDGRSKGAIAQARYRARHPEKIRAAMKEFDARPERKAAQAARARKKRMTEAYKEWARSYRARPHVKEKQAVYSKTENARKSQKKYKSKPESKLRHAEQIRRARSSYVGKIENRFRSSLRRGIKRGESSTVAKNLGYSIADLVLHLEKQFLPRMNWENMDKWHIDHIIPISKFNIQEVGDSEFMAAWSLANLRPLWAKDNIAKRAKVLSLL